jgi:uncharacterized protein
MIFSMIDFISKQLKLDSRSVENIIALIDDGATIPFIARYRKEKTGGLDEVAIAAVRDAYDVYKELEKRKLTILETIESQGKLTSELKNKIEECSDKTTLEDIYLPYKPKRNTKAETARKKGLEPLAKIIMAQNNPDVRRSAVRFAGSNGVEDVDDAIEGAGFIIAEWISENAVLRHRLRSFFRRNAVLVSKKIKTAVDEKETYKNYYDKKEPAYRASSHRILAVFRGEKEGVLRVSVKPETADALEIVEDFFIKRNSAVVELMQDIIKDAYKRLLAPSLENELRAELKEKADAKAIQVFARNLEQLLMLPPLPHKRILAIDPGFRTGCKVVCLDENGNLLHNQTIYPHPPQRQTTQAMKTISSLVQQFDIDAIAVGNGTAGRETENLISRIRFDRKVLAVMVNESGASVYSASKIAREEFPDYDITVRGAVSIGRRLADPLAELVKIDPKSIGVGQYQHDVDQAALKKALDDVVISCVNRVGVDVNTASKELLQYVSGLGPSLAAAIVKYRSENGDFHSRNELMNVPRLGAKAFEQAAGFIRIRNAVNPLDNTAVHPESYHIVEKMASDLGLEIHELIRNGEAIGRIDPQKYVGNGVHLQTINDILDELMKPNRDPRKQTGRFKFSDKVQRVEDLAVGMVLPGIITNITGFGAFCDIGVHQDALIHISKLAGGFVSDPHDIVALNEYVEVEVLSVDVLKKRINLKLIKKL